MPVRHDTTPGTLKSKALKVALAFSLGAVLHLPPWMELLPDAPGAYTYGYRVGWNAVAALLLNWSLLSLGLLLVQSRVQSTARRFGLCLLSVWAANSLRLALIDQSIYLNLAQMAINLGWPIFLTLYGLPILGLWAWIWFSTHTFHKVGQLVLTLLLPLGPLLLARTVGPLLVRPRPATQMAASLPPPKPGDRTGSAQHPRTVLLIFDEMDQNWTFDARPARLKLPNLDRFRGESIYCSQAYPPTAQTHTAIPSLLTGRVVQEARTSADRELLLQYRDQAGQWQPWSSAPDLFRRVSELGQASVFINHYHAFGAAYFLNRPGFTILRHPYFTEWETAEGWHRTFTASFKRQWAAAADALPGFVHFTRHEDKNRSVPPLYRLTLDRALKAVQNPAINLVVVHWPIPHGPAIIDLDSGRVPDDPPPGRSNLDNLALVDRTLGLLREAMESSGTWDSSLVILTSDHWQRKAADPALAPPPEIPGIPQSRHRVPLMIKWPSQTQGAVRDQPINGIAVFDLILRHQQGLSQDARPFLQTPWPGSPFGYYAPGIP